jgi:adenosine/AMP kinase
LKKAIGKKHNNYHGKKANAKPNQLLVKVCHDAHAIAGAVDGGKTKRDEHSRAKQEAKINGLLPNAVVGHGTKRKA